jgi:hypothetical protein
MAAQTSASARGRLLRQVMRSVRFLRNADHQTGVAMGAALEAGARWLSPQPNRAEATRALARAIEIADAAGAALLAAAGRYWLGELRGDAEGEEQRARATAWLTDQGVQDPQRLAFVIIPGFRAR